MNFVLLTTMSGKPTWVNLSLVRNAWPHSEGGYILSFAKDDTCRVREDPDEFLPKTIDCVALARIGREIHILNSQ